VDLTARDALELDGAGTLDPGTDDLRRLAALASLQGPDVHRRQNDVHVDPIEQRTAEASAIRPHALGRTDAAAGPVAAKPARARVHRADDEGSGREGRLRLGTRDRHASVFERLAKCFERGPTKLGELVEKEDTVVGEAHFSRTRVVSAADEADLADRVVGRPKGAPRNEAAGGSQETCHAMDGCDLEGLSGGQGG
jgi:hypothetical protein